tara:strand:+ start:53 stop:937 length:885 start_codon:yes stop_codon:yes gene_type:complete
MPSSYTLNLGVEKIGSGEQAGTWGTTTNLNFDIIDRAVNGVQAISLSGTTTTLTTTNGVLSEGGAKVLVLGGSPSGENTITIDPNTQDKVYFVHNNTNQTATFTQGSGGNASIPAGAKGIIFADGEGSGAKVTDLLDGFSFGGTKINSTAAELNIVDGGNSATSTTIVDADRLIVNDDGTMVQAAVTDLRTYVNANLVTVPSAITAATHTLTPASAQSIYQKVDTSSNNVALTLAIGSLAIGQYIIVDKTSSSNTLTLSYPSNSQGVSLGNSASFAIAINQNGTIFTFVETIKY